MDYKELIDKLVRELSFRVGIPNIHNKEHQRIMSEILTEWGKFDEKKIIFEFLTEAEPNKNDERYVSVGFGRFKLKGKQGENDPTYEKDDKGNYVKLSKDDSEGGGGETPQEEPKQGTAITGKGGDSYKANLPKGDPASTKKDISKGLSKESQKVFKDFTKRVEERISDLSEDKQSLIKTGLDKINTLYSDESSDSEKSESAQWIIDNLKFSTNASGRKAYLNSLGGNRKILSGPQGTNNSEDLVKKLQQYGEVKQYDAKGTAQKLTTAAKPDLGKENEFSPKDNPRVKEFFEGNPITKRIREGLWGLYGVKDENGKMKMPSSQYSKEYLEQSFSNPALSNTIKVAEEQSKLGNLDSKVVTALKEHQNRLSKITQDYKIPSEDAAQAIEESYNTMMVGLHTADSDIASAVMKQLAENRLYEEELARGEEVYLPSNGSFPGGDKIKVGGLERVSLVSCKFGKSGRTYGCPANAKAVTSLHPDENKRNNQGQYVGEDGYTLVVNDELIKGEDTTNSIEKTKSFISDKLNEIGLLELFNNEEITQISQISTEYREYIESIKSEIEGTKPADRYWKLFNDKLSEKEDEFKDRMGDVIQENHLEQLIGKNNVKNAKNRKGQVSPEVILSAIEISNNIKTSNGYGLEHNKQYYDENGDPKSITDMGTNNPDDYSITFRMKRTAGRSGGGCQLSYTGDGETPDTFLEEDGLLTKDGKTITI